MIRSIAMVLFILSSVPAGATNVLKGRVQMMGSIVDSPCTIRVGNDSQTIDFNPVALNSLANGNTTTRQPLNIHISDCTTSTIPPPMQRFKLTLEGQPAGNNFAIHGAAKGISLRIEDEHGNLISPGTSIEHEANTTDSLILNYSLKLVGSGHTLESGDYHVTIKLRIQHF